MNHPYISCRSLSDPCLRTSNYYIDMFWFTPMQKTMPTRPNQYITTLPDIVSDSWSGSNVRRWGGWREEETLFLWDGIVRPFVGQTGHTYEATILTVHLWGDTSLLNTLLLRLTVIVRIPATTCNEISHYTQIHWIELNCFIHAARHIRWAATIRNMQLFTNIIKVILRTIKG